LRERHGRRGGRIQATHGSAYEYKGAGALCEAAGKLKSDRTAPAESENGSLLDAESVKQLRRSVGLILRSNAGFQRRAEIAWTRGRDDLESLIYKKTSQRHALVIAAWRIMENKHYRTLAIADILNRAALGSGDLGCRIQLHQPRRAPRLEESEESSDDKEGKNNQKKYSAREKSGFHNISVSQGG
jgi:hypothetical protein